MVSAKKADFNEIAERFGIDPVVARIIRNRDVVGEEAIEKFLHGTTADLYDPMLLKDAVKAAEILCGKTGEKKKIRVIGDYDIDGVCCSSPLWWETISSKTPTRMREQSRRSRPFIQS